MLWIVLLRPLAVDRYCVACGRCLDLGGGIPERKEVLCGTKGLEVMICSFFEDHFPNVEWLQKVISEEPDRMPRR